MKVEKYARVRSGVGGHRKEARALQAGQTLARAKIWRNESVGNLE